MSDTILVERDGAIATVVLNRPEKLNALPRTMRQRPGGGLEIAARRIADGAPLLARWHKKFARLLRELRPLLAQQLEEGYAYYRTEDFKIGRQAFLAIAKPEFKGTRKKMDRHSA